MSQLSLFKGLVGRVSVLLVFAVGAVGLFLMMGGLGEGQEVERIDYPENGTATVVAYIAADPEGATVTWSLTGNDEEDFDIDGGALTFKTPPDFEDPKGSGNPTNIYTVTVEATEGTTDTVTQLVEVWVTNVEEAGEVTLSTVQPQEEVAVTTSLTDPDIVRSDSIKWQWARSASKSGPWTDIKDKDDNDEQLGESPNYIPTKDDAGKWLRATASYLDGHCPDCAVKKTAQAVSDNPVRATPYMNEAPVFDQDPDTVGVQVSFDEDPDSPRVQMRIAENSPAGTAIGAPATATDLGQDGRQETLTYTLNGNDRSPFDIERGTGQIKVLDNLDNEVATDTDNNNVYNVMVQATDSSGLFGTIDVAIEVTNVDEAPTITGGDTSTDHAENTAIGDAVSVYRATDQEDNQNGNSPQNLTWSLSGADADKFAIGNGGNNPDFTRGELRFRAMPNFEARADAGRNNVYDVVVVVTDSAGNTATRGVTVKVTNVEEQGKVTLSNLQPQARSRITATLSDDDGSISGASWSWGDGRTGATSSSTTSSTYTPDDDDSGVLTVTVTYTDGSGSETETVTEDSIHSIRGVPDRNQNPTFPKRSITLSVTENTVGGTDIGEAVTADDENDDILTYSLSGSDAASFSFDEESAQISTKAALDYETKRSYRVTVMATDPTLRSASASVTINVTDVDEPPEITAGETAIDYAEGGAGPVTTYQGADPERETIIWALSGVDAEDFSISTRGVLTFKVRPDYEDEKDSNTDNVYSITVSASDGGENKDEEEITVAVTNVDEPGKITFSNLQPQEDEQVTAALSDPDEVIASSDTWQWARSASRSGPWTDIRDAGDMTVGKSANYMPTKGDVGKYLRVTARYRDDHGRGKTVQEVSDNAVRRTPYVDMNPDFKDADGNPIERTDRSIAENSKGNTPVGDAVAATDIGENDRQEVLTYTLEGTDAASFDIDRRTGQIKAKAALNNETKDSYTVTVIATDPSGKMDSIPVTITVTDVDEAPVIDGLATINNTPENQTGIDTDLANSGVQAANYTAPDPESRGPVRFTLAGTDADDFTISGSGELSFMKAPNYEAPTDSGGNNVYNVTVQATDVGRNTSSLNVTIKVANEMEPGTVTLSHLQPQVGENLTARLTDPDGGTRSISWQWYRGAAALGEDGTVDDNVKKCSEQGSSPPCSIDGATSATYRPITADHDGGPVLMVVASYTDRLGSGQSAAKKSEYRGKEYMVQGTKSGNKAPRFLNTANGRDITTAEREVNEEAETGAIVRIPVMATDEDDTNLDYSLSGTDASSFDIDRATGQIETKAALDFETKKTYTVDVRATDPESLRDSIRVTIRVLDVDERPELLKKALVVRGERSIGYSENDEEAVASYTAAGPNAANSSWNLTGPDASDFSISRTGQLTFRSTPNFESPADANRDNTYEVTVNASTRSVRDTITVTVDVANVDEEGELTLSPARGNVGAQITATLTDQDGNATNVAWQWEGSRDGSTGWTNISGATSNTYTPDADDVGNYLRATAVYADPEGPGKRAEAITTGAVRSDDDGVVTLSPARLAVGDTVTARVTDPDGNIRNTTWQWASSSDGQTGWSDITGANSATYTIVAADIGDFLRATASYDDGDGTGKSAEGVSSLAVVEDDDGSVTLSPTRPQVGSTVTATLRDPDGGVTGTTWQWASSSNGTTGWSNLSGATSATYTVVDANVGDYLRATANYADAAGTGKSAEGITAAAVIEDDDGSVTLSPSSPEVGNTVTATLSDPDGAATAVTWVWEISSNGTTGWSAIIGETSRTYTITAANLAGSYLRGNGELHGPGRPE